MSALKLKFLSHGTLESRDLEKTRQFYEECLGFETVRTSARSLMIRLGGENTIAVVENPRKEPMTLLNHNGVDVATRKKVDRCCEITRPADQHGTYSFYFADLDDNWWEILANPRGGYSWMFTQGRDLAAWGAGPGDEVNPNRFKPRGAEAKP